MWAVAISEGQVCLTSSGITCSPPMRVQLRTTLFEQLRSIVMMRVKPTQYLCPSEIMGGVWLWSFPCSSLCSAWKAIGRSVARLRGGVPRMPSSSGSNPSTLICANMEGIHTRSPWSSTVARGLLRLEGLGKCSTYALPVCMYGRVYAHHKPSHCLFPDGVAIVRASLTNAYLREAYDDKLP